MAQQNRRTTGSMSEMAEVPDNADGGFGRARVRAFAAAALAFVACLTAFAPMPSFAAGGPLVQDAPEKPKRTVEAADVYYGDPASEWSKPAEVDADAVFAEIEEFKRIRDEKIEPGDAKYDLLLSKATRRFKAAVRAAAKDGGYDLVAKVGSVKGCDSVPAITQTVISKL